MINVYIDFLNFLSSDIHECVEYGNVCSNGGTCRNLMGGYICTCPVGWTGDNCTIGEETQSSNTLNIFVQLTTLTLDYMGG